jgi:hypothetical protein
VALPSCKECEAIYQEVLDLVEIARQSKPGPDATPQQLVDWFDQRDNNENYQMRMRPAVAKALRRLVEHQKLTGHRIPVPLPPGGLTSAN